MNSINPDVGEIPNHICHNWDEDFEAPSYYDRFDSTKIPVKKIMKIVHDDDDFYDKDHNQSKKGPRSEYSFSSTAKKDLKNKGDRHLMEVITEPFQIPLSQNQIDEEGSKIDSLRSKKLKEYERAEYEAKKKNDFRLKLFEKSNNFTMKSTDNMLSKKAYTYNYNGDIIFVKKANADTLPSTQYLPKYGTKRMAVSKIPENTIHKVPNELKTQEEYVDQLF